MQVTHPVNHNKNPEAISRRAPKKCPLTGNVGTDPVSLNPQQPGKVPMLPRCLCKWQEPKGQSSSIINLRRPPASQECASALQSSAQRFTGAPLPWPPAPGGSSHFPAQLSSRAKPPRRLCPTSQQGWNTTCKKGSWEIRNPEFQGDVPMLSKPVTWFGELLLPVAPLALEYHCCCSRTSTDTLWDGKSGRATASQLLQPPCHF